MTTLDLQAEYLTAVQTACRTARKSKRQVDLQKAAALLDSDRYEGLPDGAKVDLAAAYSAAFLAVTGFMA